MPCAVDCTNAYLQVAYCMCSGQDCFTEPVIDVIAPENELAIAPCVIKRIDCNTVKVEDLKQWYR